MEESLEKHDGGPIPESERQVSTIKHCVILLRAANKS